MSTKVIYLEQNQPAEKKNEPAKFPLWRVVFERIKEKKDELYNRKVAFLFQQAFQCFYDAQEPVILSAVDIPYFFYERRRKKIAYDKAVKALLYVIKEKRVDECYRKRMKQIKSGRV